MQDKHYDSLEDFFRKGVQKYEFEFVEEDWRKMEAKLDSSGRHRPSKWLDFLKKLFLILGIVAVAWFSYYYLNSTSTVLPKVEETVSAKSSTDDGSPERNGTEGTNQSNQGDDGLSDNAKSQQIHGDNNPKSSMDNSGQASIDDRANDVSPERIGTETSNQSNQANKGLSENAKSQQIDADIHGIDDSRRAETDSKADDADQQVADEKTEVGQRLATQEEASAPAPETHANHNSSLGAKSGVSNETSVKGNPKIDDSSIQENFEMQENQKKDLNGKPLGTGSVISSVQRNDHNTKATTESKAKKAKEKDVNNEGKVINKEKGHLKDIEQNAKGSEDRVEEAVNKPLYIKLSNSAKQTSHPEGNKLSDSDDGGAGGSAKDNRIIHRIMSVSSLAPELGSAFSHPELSSAKRGKIEAPTLEEEEILSSRSSWAIGVIAAPDFSSVGLVDNLQPGKKFGVSIEYPISRKFSVSTAIVRSTNNYKVQGEVYRAPAGFWRQVTNGIVPESVSARCEILDIPINLRYTITNKPKNRLFISSGFSTYFMLNEQYDFTYRPINPGPVERWEVSNENQHIFGIVNFSAGYEFLMANNLSFQVEPFLKVPITDIGFGQVDLFSTGALFSLKYHFMRSKLRPLRIKR